MRLVVDANILFSFFRDNPVRFIIVNTELLGLQLFSPAHVLEELSRNIPDLVKYTKSSPKEVKLILEELKEFIDISNSSEYKEFKERAQKLSPHKSEKDTPYFALALKLNCPIWSNEPAFKRQSEVKVFNTKELREFLKESSKLLE